MKGNTSQEKEAARVVRIFRRKFLALVKRLTPHGNGEYFTDRTTVKEVVENVLSGLKVCVTEEIEKELIFETIPRFIEFLEAWFHMDSPSFGKKYPMPRQKQYLMNYLKHYVLGGFPCAATLPTSSPGG